jgi:hypothetical protein
MHARADLTQDRRRVRSARAVSPMGLERQDRGPVGYCGAATRAVRAPLPAKRGHGAAQRVFWGGQTRQGRLWQHGQH